MLAFIIQIVILATLMFMIARHEADISWPKLFMVFVPMILVVQLLSVVIGPLAILVYFVGIMLALKLWFYVDWGKASLIAILQVVANIILGVIFSRG